jgi:pantoate--beta-alanine ligase
MYPPGFSTRVEVDELTERLEGAHRPGHFAGVTTVVAKLFALTAPCISVFGQKDYQQWKIVERLARDLDLRVEVLGAPIVREPDGLALSSRNRYLSPDERQRALAIDRGLRLAAAAFDAGERSAETLRSLAATPIEDAFDSVDYVALADPETLAPLGAHTGERALLAVAARIGKTRLIDNRVLGQ